MLQREIPLLGIRQAGVRIDVIERRAGHSPGGGVRKTLRERPGIGEVVLVIGECRADHLRRVGRCIQRDGHLRRGKEDSIRRADHGFRSHLIRGPDAGHEIEIVAVHAAARNAIGPGLSHAGWRGENVEAIVDLGPGPAEIVLVADAEIERQLFGRAEIVLEEAGDFGLPQAAGSIQKLQAARGRAAQQKVGKEIGRAHV